MPEATVPQTPRRKGMEVRLPRIKLGGVAVLVFLTLLFGVAPIAAYVVKQNPPDDARTATVVGVRHVEHVNRNGTSARTMVRFALPGGTLGEFPIRGTMLTPEVGDHVEVYRRHGHWSSPAEVTLVHLFQGIAVVLAAMLGSGLWLLHRRRLQRLPEEDDEPSV